ncbi:TetR family transcriptional regulator C-terminal domain-containing protein [Demequina sp. SYSU T00039]|uniref:TetR family transcriptional regulator C-terminal domain-containing protein n=1 Tax=Demequina lignilytica TaxID=3051663 RepID=A0AAW7M834_9MICO|nr:MULTISPECIES: TetR family transcriptional regulator C-terminal domain-containing protein [unclassified Demequina]MDN4477561.1 TetR family transcriptional regulator C-terminal domain-containing protein [Demequina sp. SYSU T00039-1]MDN4488088.1 TetR family transcriptional regulator C-terminal domain-containing protein [Demequina sp. SYSU T00039]
MPSTDRRRLPAAERRAQIAGAARAVALRDGLAAVTLRGVAAEAAVAPALVAHYSPSMEALVAETFAGIVAAELDEVRYLAGGDAPDALDALLRTLLGGGREDVTAVWVEAWALGRRNAELAAAVRDQMDAWHVALVELLARGAADGSLTVADPDAVAWHVLGMIDGLNAQALVRWRQDDARVALAARAVEAMVGLPRGAVAAPERATVDAGETP